MCLVKRPKITAPSGGSSDKPLPVLRNPFLDGIGGAIRSISIGRNMLRIDRGMDAGPGRFAGGGGASGGSSGSFSGGSSGGSSFSGSSGGRTRSYSDSNIREL